MKEGDYASILANAGIKYKINEKLSKYCAYGTGGNADIMVFPKSEEELRICINTNLPTEVIGFGSDILCSDAGFGGVIINTRLLDKIEVKGATIKAECGAQLQEVRRIAELNCLSGLEFTVDVPATVGGAICRNVGCFSKAIGDHVAYVRTTHGVYNKENCDFAYRSSLFYEQNVKNNLIVGEIKDNTDENACNDYKEKNNANKDENKDAKTENNICGEQKEVIYKVCFALKPGESDIIEAKTEKFRQLRKKSQPRGKSCGSVFMNDGYFAGKIIDSVGLKGYKIGGARVSEKHANFIINEGGTSSDIYRLIRHVKNIVSESLNIKLKEEITYIGDFDI